MVDFEMVAKELGFELEDVTMLLDMFIESCENSIAALESGIEGLDFALISSEAHSIKGSASNLMLEHLADLAFSIESAAKSGEESFDYSAKLEAIKDHIDKLKEQRLNYA